MPLAALLWGGHAVAASARLSYEAPSGCATHDQFEARVAERGEHFDPRANDELRVVVAERADGFHGSLQVVGPHGESNLRSLTGKGCEEVVAALVVVSAIALRDDPSTPSTSSEQPPIVPAENETTTLAAPAPKAPALESATRSPKPVPANSHTPRLRSTNWFPAVGARHVKEGTLRLDLARSFTLFAGGELGILPSTVVPRFDLSFDSASFVTPPDGQTVRTGVIPRFHVSYLGPGTYHHDSTQVDVHGVSAALGLCLSPYFDSLGFTALICVEYGIGALDFKSSRGGENNSHTLALQTVGIGLETRYRLGSTFHVAMKWQLDVVPGNAQVNGTDGTPILDSPLLKGYGMLGLGASF